MTTQFESFKDFYPFYLNEHQHPICRRLHFVGSTLVLLLLAYALWMAHWAVLWFAPVIAYGMAWVGHFFFEKNQPATFKHPFYSFAGDWVMYKDMLIGKVAW